MKRIVLTLILTSILAAASASCSPGQSSEDDMEKIVFPKFPKTRIVLRSDESGEAARTVTWSDDRSRKVEEVIDYKDGSQVIVWYARSGFISEIKEFFQRDDTDGSRHLHRHTVMSRDGKTPLRDSAYKIDGTLAQTGRLLKNGDFEIVAFFDGHKFSRRQILERVGGEWLTSFEEVRDRQSRVISKSQLDRQRSLLVKTYFDESGRATSEESWVRSRNAVSVLQFASDNTVTKRTVQTVGMTEVTTFRPDGTRAEIRRWESKLSYLTVEKFDVAGKILFRQEWILGQLSQQKPTLAIVTEIGRTPGLTRSFYFRNNVLSAHSFEYREHGSVLKVVIGKYSDHGNLIHEEVHDGMGNVLDSLDYANDKNAKLTALPANYLRYEHLEKPEYLGDHLK